MRAGFMLLRAARSGAPGVAGCRGGPASGRHTTDARAQGRPGIGDRLEGVLHATRRRRSAA